MSKARQILGPVLQMAATYIVATSAFLVAVCLLTPSLAVYSNGECTFNTKGTLIHEHVHACEIGLSSPAITDFCMSLFCVRLRLCVSRSYFGVSGYLNFSRYLNLFEVITTNVFYLFCQLYVTTVFASTNYILNYSCEIFFLILISY